MMSLSGGEVWAWGFWVRVLGAPWCSPRHLFSRQYALLMEENMRSLCQMT